MKRLALLSFSLLLLFAAGSVQAQDALPLEPAEPTAPVRVDNKPAESSLSPEMQRYLSETRRYNAPPDLVRLRAQAKAQQRMERIAAMKWYGMSNSRPVAGATPFIGTTYSPRWSGNLYNGDWTDRGHHRTMYYTADEGPVLLRR